MREDFGRYRLLEKLGGGSLGEVFRAESDSGQTVALKRLAREHLGKGELAALLLREADIAAKMQHDRLLGAIDRGAIGGWPFLTQRLAAQGSAAERLAPALPRAELAQFAIDLCEGLAAVHALGYTHCDLSPGNLLFDEGRALLADFSAATKLGERQQHPQGTYAFMSPEQVRSEPLDERSDLFSAATLLWLAATGDRIFARSAPHLCFMAVVHEEPPTLSPHMQAIEAALRPALAKRPADRQTNLSQLAADFVAALPGSKP